ncbi:MAPEG family protein [Rhodoplanes sp. Z2-YC6860]|uniref:MAPEG family protein n=1 Tax=Rhodoplanes sp. Z2-YC6860 TaxID=674703 RepID=UPI00078E64A6|nr:MAPEG family protein [Rhodoplanes sp. Z2-YC6860]AMN42553.1 MAPEG family protein [Rhodoplanes sp. Z2-YC6860]
MPKYTAVVTLLAVVFYLFIGTRVSVAHAKFGVKLPATAGHPDFERIHRVHMNTLEWMPVFLPLLWLSAVYFNDAASAAIGLAWIVGRVLYYVGYREAVDKRRPGFFIQAMACLMLLIGAVAGIVMHW